jgi:hypothetical protein
MLSIIIQEGTIYSSIFTHVLGKGGLGESVGDKCLNDEVFSNHNESVTWGGAGGPKCRLRRGDRNKVKPRYLLKSGESGEKSSV